MEINIKMKNRKYKKDISSLTNWCPCTVCIRKEGCDVECMNFQRYTNTHPEELREKRYYSFIKKQTQGIITI